MWSDVFTIALLVTFPTCFASKMLQFKTSSINNNIEIIDIKSDAIGEVYKSWEDRFPKESPLFHYNAKQDPEEALLAVHESLAFVMQWLPTAIISRLASFPFQKSGPSAILLRGLPIDVDIQPTPIKASVFDDAGDREIDPSTALVPIAESWLLGISRLMGFPTGAPLATGDRGGLIRDITQNADDVNDLPMHRDYPDVARDPKFAIVEPEIFILFGVRGDVDDSGAKTVVMDSKRLLDMMDPTDRALLRTTTVQTEIKLSNGEYMAVGRPFLPIIDNKEDGTSVVTLNNLPKARYVSPDGGAQTVEAYKRISQLAFDNGERVNLKAGDMLIIQNSRLVHGRTKFYNIGSCLASGRWLIKTYVTNRLWKIPGETSLSDAAHTDYPNLNPMGWGGFRHQD